MKINQLQEKVFKPINITLETKAEFVALYAALRITSDSGEHKLVDRDVLAPMNYDDLSDDAIRGGFFSVSSSFGKFVGENIAAEEEEKSK